MKTCDSPWTEIALRDERSRVRRVGGSEMAVTVVVSPRRAWARASCALYTRLSSQPTAVQELLVSVPSK